MSPLALWAGLLAGTASAALGADVLWDGQLDDVGWALAGSVATTGGLWLAEEDAAEEVDDHPGPAARIAWVTRTFVVAAVLLSAAAVALGRPLAAVFFAGSLAVGLLTRWSARRQRSVDRV